MLCDWQGNVQSVSFICWLIYGVLFHAVQDWQIAKRKQDQHLDNIEKGLSTLKGIGEAMGETLKTQDVLIDTIDTKVGLCAQWRTAARLARAYGHN